MRYCFDLSMPSLMPSRNITRQRMCAVRATCAVRGRIACANTNWERCRYHVLKRALIQNRKMAERNEFCCWICSLSFATNRQYLRHLTTKKHIDMEMCNHAEAMEVEMANMPILTSLDGAELLQHNSPSQQAAPSNPVALNEEHIESDALTSNELSHSEQEGYEVHPFDSIKHNYVPFISSSTYYYGFIPLFQCGQDSLSPVEVIRPSPSLAVEQPR